MKYSKKSQQALKQLQRTINSEARKIPKNHYQQFFQDYLYIIRLAQRSDYLSLERSYIKDV